jgi:hypothetical protein
MSNDLKLFIGTPSLNREMVEELVDKNQKTTPVRKMTGKEPQEQAKPYTGPATRVKKFWR